MAYPRFETAHGLSVNPEFPAVEREVLEFWSHDATFQESIDGRHASKEFIFYDGPPFANGLPHYGHLLTGYVKDIVPRYQTMRGKRVERRFGWDCHGLPAEVETEKQLGITAKTEIFALGIDKFNAATRESVLKYTKDWERYVTRQARWVDFANDYKTLDPSYMESVLWAFKALYDKGLVYHDFRVLAYCWRCETPLSNTETRMDDVYHDRQDPALTVTLELETGEHMLVWTTTPWTLPSNLAVAVGPDLDYVVLECDGVRYVLGEEAATRYAHELGDAVRVAGLKGRDLVGRRYTPPFSFLDGTANAFQVLAGDFVSAEDGTGIVHMAPAFGEDDQKACNEAGIPTILTVDNQAVFTSLVPDYEGLQVFEANKRIISDLKERGTVLRHETYTHSYPNCWRCDTPLIYKAVSSWFVAASTFRERMRELNQQINWMPEHIRDGQFDKWLAGARDWAISRNRFWGSPVPVWQSEDPAYPRTDVYGSVAELERDFGVQITDLHRPMIDELVRPNPDDPTGKSMMRRVSDVLDCWFESGSMPFAQVHYPFENREWFESHYPGDFIVEYTSQTRGWFYTMHVLATALFDRPAFRNAVVHGTILGSDNRKMSKSLRNYPDVYEMFDRYGADAVRWALISSSVLRGGDISINESGIRDSVRQALLPLWNAWYFFSLNANAENYEASVRTDSVNLLDRYVLAKTHELLEQCTTALDRYDIAMACTSIRRFLDALTNWYIRRSRKRFWAGDRDAFDTLYTVLETLCRAMAPLAPLTVEAVWKGLTGGRSVHLADWPAVDDFPADPLLVGDMDTVREVCSTALRLRKTKGLRVRQPLRSMTVAVPEADRLQAFGELVADEVNVKSVEFTTDLAAHCRRSLSVVPRALGPRLGKDVQRVIKAVKSGDWTVSDGAVTAGGVDLREGEYVLKIEATDGDNSATLLDGAGVVVLDTDVSPELAAEGLARDVIRAIQQARRDADLDISDRIAVRIEASDLVRGGMSAHRELVAGETLATDLSFGSVPEENAFEADLADGERVRLVVSKV